MWQLSTGIITVTGVLIQDYLGVLELVQLRPGTADEFKHSILQLKFIPFRF